MLALLIIRQNMNGLANRVLFFTVIVFATWLFLDSVYWASNRSDVAMFMWSVTILIEPLVYIGSLYFLYVLIDKQDVAFRIKLKWFLLWVPLAVIAPTQYLLSGVEVSSCLVKENSLSFYSYFIEVVCIMWITALACQRYRASTIKEQKDKIIFLTTGVLLLCLAFTWGNLFGSFTENWQIAQYGLFGMPIFIAFLLYAIEKYKIFNIHLIGSLLFLIVMAFSITATYYRAMVLHDYDIVDSRSQQ